MTDWNATGENEEKNIWWNNEVWVNWSCFEKFEKKFSKFYNRLKMWYILFLNKKKIAYNPFDHSKELNFNEEKQNEISCLVCNKNPQFLLLIFVIGNKEFITAIKKKKKEKENVARNRLKWNVAS